MSGDTELDRHVAPADWVNPTPSGRYHLVIIGAGPAGLVAAAGAAGLGAKVALIERHRLGGDCLNDGCVPSKALIKSARVAATVRDAHDFGVLVPDGTHVDFPAVMQRMREIRTSLAPHDSAERFRSLGVDVYFGSGRFTGRDAIEVSGQTLRFRRALIATGARAARPPISGLAETGFVTNETIFSRIELPQRLAIVGAGPIGCELAQAFSRFGSHVTLMTSGTQILPKDDADAAMIVESALRRDGVEIRKATRVTHVERDGSAKRLLVQTAGTESTVLADELLIAVGRTPNVESLGLDRAGISFHEQDGVWIDEHLRTTNRAIFAAGDVCSRFQFTHAADAMARIVLQNALFPGRQRTTSLVIPRCTFTDPEIACVGLTESEASRRGIAVVGLREELSHIDRAVLDGETAGFAKVLLRAGTDEILGATIVATSAGEMLNEITLAMTARLGLGSIAKTIHPYPTQTEILKRLADQAQRRRLTPFVKRLFSGWFAWTSAK